MCVSMYEMCPCAWVPVFIYIYIYMDKNEEKDIVYNFLIMKIRYIKDKA